MHLTYICEAEISKSGQINIRGKTLWKYEHKRRDFPLKHFDFGETCVFFGKPCTMALLRQLAHKSMHSKTTASPGKES